MNQFDTFIFDLDGTLVEFNLNFDEIRRQLNIRERYVLESINKLDSDLRDEKNRILKNFEINSAKKARLLPFAKEIIEIIHKKGLSKGIVTRNCRESAEIIMERFNLPLDFLITRDDAEPKPSPEPVFKAIEIAGSTPEKSILVGDYKFDIIAGKNAGIKTVLLLTEKNRRRAEKFVHLADYVIGGLDELETFI